MLKARPRSKRLLAWSWVPAVLVMALTIATAAGISLVPSATSATSGTVDVSGTLGNSAAIDTATGCAGPLSVGAMSLGVTSDTGTGNCSVSFTTNNPTGARIDVYDNNAAVDGADFFCHSGDAGCAGGTAVAASLIGEGAGAGPFAVDTADSFGVQLEAVGGGGAAVWVDGTVDFAAAEWYPMLDASGVATEACDSGGASTGGANCDFVWAAQPAADNTTGGTYDGTAVMEVTTE